MELLEIRQLGPEDEAAFLAGLAAWDGDDPAWLTFAWEAGMSHAEHLRILANEFAGKDLAPGRVQHTMLYGFLDGVIVGRCSVRHELNARLSQIGGHIGYGVAPPFRRQGFATQLFRAGREHLKSLGVDRAFVHCDRDNVGSRTLIERAGGILQDEVPDPEDETNTVLRFWVAL